MLVLGLTGAWKLPAGIAYRILFYLMPGPCPVSWTHSLGRRGLML